MSKRRWILTILILFGVGYLVLSKVYPSVGTSIDNYIGPSITGVTTGLVTTITESAIWQAWGYYIAAGIGGILSFLLFWQGHNTFNKIRGVAVQSAAHEAGWQTTPPVQQPMPIQTAPKIQVAPTPVVAPNPVVEPQKETT